jgi:hypothetical protein
MPTMTVASIGQNSTAGQVVVAVVVVVVDLP